MNEQDEELLLRAKILCHKIIILTRHQEPNEIINGMGLTIAYLFSTTSHMSIIEVEKSVDKLAQCIKDSIKNLRENYLPTED